MAHHRQCLSFGLETGDYPAGVHAQLDDLEGDPPLNGFALFGQIDDPHAAFAQFFQNEVTPDLETFGLFGWARHQPGLVLVSGRVDGGVPVQIAHRFSRPTGDAQIERCRPLEKALGRLVIGRDQVLDFAPEVIIRGAAFDKERLPIFRIQLQRGKEKLRDETMTLTPCHHIHPLDQALSRACPSDLATDDNGSSIWEYEFDTIMVDNLNRRKFRRLYRAWWHVLTGYDFMVG